MSEFDFLGFQNDLEQDKLPESNLVKYINDANFDIRAMTVGVDIRDYIGQDFDQSKKDLKEGLMDKGRKLYKAIVETEKEFGVKVSRFLRHQFVSPDNLSHLRFLCS